MQPLSRTCGQCFLLFSLLSIATVAGCSYASRSSSGSYHIIEHSAPVYNYPNRTFKLAGRVQGLFIGISNYSIDSGQRETAAHTISAALFEDFFFRAASLSDTYGTTTNIGGEASVAVKDSTFTLMADFRHRVESPDFDHRSFTRLIDRLPGANRLLHEYEEDWSKPDKDKTWAYFGKGRPVTKRRVLDEIQSQLRFLKAVDTNENHGYFVFYISAHGAIGPDGRSYVFPADANKRQPETWLSFDELIQPFATYAAEALERESGNTEFLIFLDVCQNRSESTEVDIAEKNGQVISALPPRVTVLVSASPGQYAFHWTSQDRSTVTATDVETRGIAIGRRGIPKPREGTFDITLQSRMSALPVAAHRLGAIISRNFKNAPSMHAKEQEQVENATKGEDGMLAWLEYKKVGRERGYYYSPREKEWMVTAPSLLEWLVDVVPRIVKENKASDSVELRQTSRIYRSNIIGDFPLLYIIRAETNTTNANQL